MNLDENEKIGLGVVTTAVVFVGVEVTQYLRNRKRNKRKKELRRELDKIRKAMDENHWMSKNFKEAIYEQNKVAQELSEL